MKTKEVETEIKELAQLLNQVVLDKQEIEEKEEHICSELERLQATETRSMSSKSRKHKKKAAIPSNRLDRNNKEIRIGDQVRFLTPSKYKSKAGTVAYFTKQRVTSVDHQGIKISKESRNLEVIEIEEESEDEH